MELNELIQKSREELAKKKAARLKAANSSVPVTQVKTVQAGSEKMFRKFGINSFSKLLTVNTAEKKFAYLGSADISLVKQFKEDVDIMVLTKRLLGIDIKDQRYYNEEFSNTLKAFGIESGSEGFEWIPTIVSDSYIDEYNLERKIAGLFTEIKMPSNPFKWPVLSNGAIARKTSSGNPIGKQTFKTDKTITFEATKLAGRYELPEELNEDSAPDAIKAARIELMKGQEKAMEIAILEGDTSGTMHFFSQLPDVDPTTEILDITAETPETSFDGLRLRAMKAHSLVAGQSAVNCGGNAVSETELSLCRAKLGKFGVVPTELATIPGPKVYNQMINLDDVRTIEQYGGQATVLSGELAKYEGMPVVPSEYLREDLDATGVNSDTPANNKFGSIIMVNRKRWFTGLRRAIQIKAENNKTENDVLDLVSFSRKAFQGTLKADGTNYKAESTVSVIFNIGL